MASLAGALWSRETRLLLLTIGLSVAALLVLARFRFPAEQRIEPPPQPLERLAARATYDELASIVQRVEQRVAPWMVVLQAAIDRPDQPQNLNDVLGSSAAVDGSGQFLVALRIRPDVAVMRLPAGARIQGVLNNADAVPLVIAEDRIRQMALVRVPPPPAGVEWRATPAQTITVPRYVVAVEGSQGGPTPRPIFLGRADRINDPRWNTTLVLLARTPVAAEGSFVFSLDGELVGMVAPDAGSLAIVPATLLTQSAEQLLETGSPLLTDFGLTLTPLTGEIIRTHGVTSGVVVHSIADGSRATGKLRAGDVIQSVDNQPAGQPGRVLLQLARMPATATPRLTVRRGEDTLSIELPPAAPEPAPAGKRGRDQ